MQDWKAKLEELQARRDDLTEQIRALQQEIRQAELTAAAEAHLDSLPEAERGVLIEAAAIRIGGGAGKPKAG